VFAVSGTINLLSDIGFPNPVWGKDVTVAGQTAPGDGICIRGQNGKSFNIVNSNNIVIRYLRIRKGEHAVGTPGDAVQIDPFSNDIILDHCSVSWGTDQTLSVGQMATSALDVTVQWCIVSEGLSVPYGSMGSLIYGHYPSAYSFHHNIYAHHDTRTPRIGNLNGTDPCGLRFDWRNNVVYNWGGPYAGYNRGDNPLHYNWVGNYYVPGASSTGEYALDDPEGVNNKTYVAGNWMDNGYPADPYDLIQGFCGIPQVEANPMPGIPVTTTDAETAYYQVLAGAGASLPMRDAVDRRIVNDIINRTGDIIARESDVGGWPTLRSRTAPPDTDQDGLPNEWESARGLDPDNFDDSNDVDPCGIGYTYIEEYLNYLVVRPDELPGDLDADGDVDNNDLDVLTGEWLVNDCNSIPFSEMDDDCDVDFREYAMLAVDWLEIY
jgi:pectate lyase